MLSTAEGPRPFQPRNPPTATQPPRRVTWRPRPSRDDHEEGGPARPPDRVPATTTPPPAPDPRPRGVVEVGPRTGSGSPHPRESLCTARAGVPRPPHPPDARGPGPFLVGPHTRPGLTPPPRLPPRLLPTTTRRNFPRWLRRGVRRLVPPPTPRRSIHLLPVVHVASCFCRPSEAPSSPRSSPSRVPPPPSTSRGPDGRPNTRRPRPCRPL